MKTKTFLNLFVVGALLIILAFSVSGAPLFEQLTSGGEGLTVEAPKNYVFAKNVNISLRFHVYNSTNYIVNMTNASCQIHIYNERNSHVAQKRLVSDGNDYATYFDNTSRLGFYPYIVWCVTKNQAGFISTNFEVTSDGTNKESWGMPVAALIALIIASLVVIALSIDKTNIFMRIIKMFIIIIVLFLTIIAAGLAVGFAKTHSAPAYIMGNLEMMFMVVVWVMRVFIGILFLYILWESLTALAQHKKKKREEKEENV